MIKSSLCTLKVLNLRDNFIKQTAAEQILDALKTNKSIVKIHMDYNPIKQQIIVEIDELCKRNRQIDEINQKNKNLIELKMKKMKASTQKESLMNEIKELKILTDKALEEASESMEKIEQLQKYRKTSEEFFTSMMPAVETALMGHTKD